VFNVFYSWGQRFLKSMLETEIAAVLRNSSAADNIKTNFLAWRQLNHRHYRLTS